jgi:hypothetical protein
MKQRRWLGIHHYSLTTTSLRPGTFSELTDFGPAVTISQQLKPLWPLQEGVNFNVNRQM